MNIENNIEELLKRLENYNIELKKEYENMINSLELLYREVKSIKDPIPFYRLPRHTQEKIVFNWENKILKNIDDDIKAFCGLEHLEYINKKIFFADIGGYNNMYIFFKGKRFDKLVVNSFIQYFVQPLENNYEYEITSFTYTVTPLYKEKEDDMDLLFIEFKVVFKIDEYGEKYKNI